VSVALEPALLAKRILRPLLSEQTIVIIQQTIGMLEYIKSPERGAGWGPFNGQTARQALFVDLLTKSGPNAIVETGTFLGATTEFMSQAGLPVFTIEAHPRNYGFSRARFWRRRNVKLVYGDSRTGLHKLFFTLMPTGMMICRLQRKLI
jgi:predicted O-methyltransferase YrrM